MQGEIGTQKPREKKKLQVKKLNGWDKYNGQHRLGVSTGWVSGWSEDEAIRELLQNLFDQIFKRADELNLKGPTHLEIIKEELDEKIFSISINDQNLGYIIWRPYGTKDSNDSDESLLALINYDSYLPIASLIIGHTEKRRSSRCAGKYGEGLKAAVSTLLRNYREFEIHQSGCTLSFFPDEEELSDGNNAILFTANTRHSDKSIKELVNDLKKKPFNAKRDKDVIQVVKGLENFDALSKFYLLYSHNEVASLEELKQSRNARDFLRLQTTHGDILWPSSTKAETDVRGSIYVEGILWEYREEMMQYGVDLKRDVSENRDRNFVKNSNLKTQVAKIIDEILLIPQPDFANLVLEELENAKEIGDANHLHYLSRYISQQSCEQLFQLFKEKKEGTPQYICTDSAQRDEISYYVCESLITITSKLACDLFAKHKKFPNLDQIKGDSLRNLKQDEKREISWPERTRLAVQFTFGDHIWKYLLQHDTKDKQNVPNCIYDPEDQLIHLSTRIDRFGNSPFQLISLIGKELNKRPLIIEPNPKEQNVKKRNLQTSKVSQNQRCKSAISFGDVAKSDDKQTQLTWREWLLQDVSKMCIKSNTINCTSTVPLSIEQKFGSTIVLCSEEGKNILDRFSEDAVAILINVIFRHSEGIIANLNWHITFNLCCTEEPIYAFADLKTKAVFVNIRCLLEEELSAKSLHLFLLKSICHEVAHIVTFEMVGHAKHAASHGRLTEDLITRVLLKEDLYENISGMNNKRQRSETQGENFNKQPRI